MPLNIPTAYANTITSFRLSGVVQPYIVTLGVHPGTPDTGFEVASAVNIAWKAAFTPANYVNRWTINETTAYYHNVTGDLEVATAGTPVAGTKATSYHEPPVNCALLVTKSTGLAGRKNKGRMFLPPFLVDEDVVDEAGVLTGSAVSSLQTLVNTFFNQLTTGSVFPVILHNTLTPLPTPVSGFVVSELLATQRRRMRH